MIPLDDVDWKKVEGLLPVIVQDWQTNAVLMLAYMNREAMTKTFTSQKLTFFSRTKKRLWTKGETSGNFLLLKSASLDCDQDTLLVRAEALGPTCHLGTKTCFADQQPSKLGILADLDQVIEERQKTPAEGSYTTSLFNLGTQKIAQKVGEEGVEVALAAVAESSERLNEEAADLMYHLLVLLRSKGQSLETLSDVLARRHKKA